MATDYRAQVHSDIRAFVIGATAAVAGTVALVLWQLDVITSANGAIAATLLGGTAVATGVFAYLLGPLIFERVFVAAPAGLGVLPFAVGIGAAIHPLMGFALSASVAIASTGAFFVLRASRRK